MNDEINKEDVVKANGVGKPKMSMQNILAVLLVLVIVFVIIAIFSGNIGSGMDGVFFVYMIGLSVVFGVVFISAISGIASVVNFIRDKEKLTFLEKKKKKIWLAFDLFFFLLLPIVLIIYLIIFSDILFSLLAVIILMNGVKAIIKNKAGSMFGRLFGWFLIIVGFLSLVILLFNFLTN